MEYLEKNMLKINYMILNNMKKNEEIATHIHDGYELTYYFSGKGYCIVDDNVTEDVGSDTYRRDVSLYLSKNRKQNKNTRYKFSACSCLIIPPYVAHYKMHTEKSTFISLVFSADKTNNVPEQILHSVMSANGQAFFSIIADEIKNRKKGYVTVIENLLACLFLEIERNVLQNINLSDFISQTVKYLDDYFLSEIDFADYSAANGYSIDYFRHKFKEFTKMSPKAYLINKRMEYAALQLVNTDVSVSALAATCRFSDYTTFSVCFKNKYGVSPLNYRKKHRVN